MLPPSVPVRSSTGHRLVLVALVLGLVLGAAAVGLTWFVSGRTAAATELPPSDAGTDAVTACAALARIPTVAVSSAGRSPAYYRLAGAASLAQAAAAGDARYRSLADALTKVVDIAQRSLDDTQAARAMDSARAACANL